MHAQDAIENRQVQADEEDDGLCGQRRSVSASRAQNAPRVRQCTRTGEEEDEWSREGPLVDAEYVACRLAGDDFPRFLLGAATDEGWVVRLWDECRQDRGHSAEDGHDAQVPSESAAEQAGVSALQAGGLGRQARSAPVANVSFDECRTQWTECRASESTDGICEGERGVSACWGPSGERRAGHSQTML